MLQGLTTVSYWASDVNAAKKWYSQLLGMEPYFNVQNFNVQTQDGSLRYTAFRIGDYQHELGIVDARYGSFDKPSGGVIVYWHVADVAVTLDKLLAMGANEAPKDRRQGFITASVEVACASE
jgi:predicted enzyme related to lactoylglutathione lyase